MDVSGGVTKIAKLVYTAKGPCWVLKQVQHTVVIHFMAQVQIITSGVIALGLQPTSGSLIPPEAASKVYT